MATIKEIKELLVTVKELERKSASVKEPFKLN